MVNDVKEMITGFIHKGYKMILGVKPESNFDSYNPSKMDTQ
jgi:hypothetical protein